MTKDDFTASAGNNGKKETGTEKPSATILSIQPQPQLQGPRPPAPRPPMPKPPYGMMQATQIKIIPHVVPKPQTSSFVPTKGEDDEK